MSKQYSKLNSDSIIVINDLVHFDRDKLFEIIDTHSYAIIRGLFDISGLKRSLKILSQQFDPSLDNASRGEKRTDIRKNFQKVTLGGASLSYNNYPRFFRTFYNPMWEEDIYKMHEHFKTLIMLRNLIYGIAADFAIDKPEENGLWSATRIHQYPRGGGFFDGHVDATLLDVAKEKNTNFFQLILAMSEKGDAFNTGGAFVDQDQNRYMIEDLCRAGDVLVYDGRSFHGVEDIDDHAVLDMSSINGRIVAMASLYSV